MHPPTPPTWIRRAAVLLATCGVLAAATPAGDTGDGTRTADPALAPAGSADLLVYARWIEGDDEVGGTAVDTEGAWEAGLMVHGYHPVTAAGDAGVTFGLDLGYDRRDLVLTSTSSILPGGGLASLLGAFLPVINALTLPVTTASEEEMAIFDAQLTLGLGIRFGPGRSWRFDLRAVAGYGFGELADTDYDGWTAGVLAGLSADVGGLVAGLEVGYELGGFSGDAGGPGDVDRRDLKVGLVLGGRF